MKKVKNVLPWIFFFLIGNFSYYLYSYNKEYNPQSFFNLLIFVGLFLLFSKLDKLLDQDVKKNHKLAEREKKYTEWFLAIMTGVFFAFSSHFNLLREWFGSH